MPQDEIRLKSPSYEQLTHLIKKVEQSINDGVYPLKRDAQPADLTEEDMTEVQDALEWIRTFLSNRRDYHRKKQLEKKAEINELREALKGRGYDLEEIKRRAAANVANQLVDETKDES